MVRFPLKYAAIFSVIAFITLAATAVPAKNNVASLACGCSYATELDISLPISHPKNRCAENGPSRDVSWVSWLSGKAKSHQFHYLDLLELLSRYKNHS